MKTRWLLVIPLAFAALAGSADASVIRDNAHLFSADAIRDAQATLDRVESESSVGTVVETIETLDGQNIDKAIVDHARRSRTHGIYILIAKNEHKVEVDASDRVAGRITRARRLAVRNVFVDQFKRRDFDAGLRQGVSELATQVAESGITPRRAGGAVPPRGQGQGFGVGSLLTIILVIVGVMFVFRLLGSLFQNRGGSGYAGGRPGMGPGYGGGGGGGGFMSSLFGGIGGALAGNWLYDQFSGRHHHGNYGDSGSYGDGGQGVSDGGDGWAGQGDGGGDWGGGGGDAGGGGDWGGGDAGGGGDWGGGGSGGGGDW